LDSKSRMLLRNDIIFIVWIERLMLGWHIDLFMGQVSAIEVL